MSTPTESRTKLSPSTPAESTRIKFSHVLPDVQQPERLDPRESFWQPIKRLQSGDATPFMEMPTQSFENLLTRNFGRFLKRHLIKEVDNELFGLEQHLFGPSYEKFIQDARRYAAGQEVYVDTESFVRLAELRQTTINQSPEFRSLLTKRTIAVGINFTVRINSYSTLELALLAAPIVKIVEFFDHNFDYFQVFLRNFAPEAFAESISHIGGTHYFGFESEVEKVVAAEIIPTESTTALFLAPTSEDVSSEIEPNLKIEPKLEIEPKEKAALSTAVAQTSKAEWAWRVANTSLLVPVILALLVLYFGLQQLSSLRDGQDKLLQHHLDILKANSDYIKALQSSQETQINAAKSQKPSGSSSEAK